jgi:hypothetical protein
MDLRHGESSACLLHTLCVARRAALSYIIIRPAESIIRVGGWNRRTAPVS